MAVVEPQLRFQDRVNRGDQRLEGVVDEMGKAEREENAEHRRGRDCVRLDLVDAGRRAVPRRFTRWAHRDSVDGVDAGVASEFAKTRSELAVLREAPNPKLQAPKKLQIPKLPKQRQSRWAWERDGKRRLDPPALLGEALRAVDGEWPIAKSQ